MPSPTRTASEHKVIAEQLKQPNGVAFKDGSLYVISIDKALRFDGIEGKLDSPQVTDISEQIKMPSRRITTGNSLLLGRTTSSISRWLAL